MITDLNKFKEIEKLIALLSVIIAILLTILYVSNELIVDSCLTSYNASNTFYTMLILCLFIFLIIFFKFSVSQLIKVLFNDKQTEI